MSLEEEYLDGPERLELHLQRAEEYEEAGDLKNALSECDKAIRIDPCFADAYNLRGTILEGMGLERSAVREYKRAIRYDPEFTEAIENLSALEAELQFLVDHELVTIAKFSYPE